ncbi:MAG: hypothetical protein KDK39_02345 [Leptospiraceae bacterium]|nr:hypothetical protein [Leptospiraceae bacterium]
MVSIWLLLIALLLTGLVMFRIWSLPSRSYTNQALFSLAAAAWVFGIFLEALWEEFLILQTEARQEPGFWVRLLANHFISTDPALFIRQIGFISWFNGFWSLVLPLFGMRLAMQFPPRRWHRYGDWLLGLLVTGMLILADHGVTFSVKGGGLHREIDFFFYVRVIFVGIAALLLIGILLYKSAEFSSPLRRLEARAWPLGLALFALVSLGSIYMLKNNEHSLLFLLLAGIGPLLLIAVLFLSSLYYRNLFSNPQTWSDLLSEINRAQTLIQRLVIFQKHQILVSVYTHEGQEQYRNILDPAEVLRLPALIARRPARSADRIQYSFFEDFDSLADESALQFMRQNYAMALAHSPQYLVLLHRIKNSLIISKSDIELTYKLLLDFKNRDCD